MSEALPEALPESRPLPPPAPGSASPGSVRLPGRPPDPWAHPRQRAWVEVDGAAITANARALRATLAPGTELMAVVKADGYGHGALPVARAALAGGARCCGVATLQEGLELRQAGIDVPVLVLGNLTQPEELRACLHWRLMPTLSGMREALLCQNIAAGGGRPMAVHLKLDTGMARLGAPWQEGPRLVEAIAGLDAVQLAGTYSHLAAADAPEGDEALTRLQQQRYDQVLTALAQRDLAPGCRHLANSAGTLRHPALHYDLVRVGLALYGHRPGPHLGGAVPLRPAMRVRARVSLIREVPAGVGVSYGHRFITRRPSRLAVLGIGYADGVPRLLSDRLEVLFGGRRLRQVGAITMDQLVLDATDVPELEVGSVVTLLGQEGEAAIGPEVWSETCDTIPWEILCGFKHRLPRLAVDGASG